MNPSNPTQNTSKQSIASDIWKKVVEAQADLKGDYKSYRNYAKDAGALVMTNGLIATLSYYESRKTPPAYRIRKDICFLVLGKDAVEYRKAMEKLLNSSSAEYMEITEKTLEVIKWMRQFSDAISNK